MDSNSVLKRVDVLKETAVVYVGVQSAIRIPERGERDRQKLVEGVLLYSERFPCSLSAVNENGHDPL